MGNLETQATLGHNTQNKINKTKNTTQKTKKRAKKTEKTGLNLCADEE
jgi:hypothetical protein